MDRTGGGRPDTVGQREEDDAGSGTSAAHRATGRPVRGRDRGPLPTRVNGLPELPPAYGETLDRGLAALGVRLPAATREAIDGHVRLLLAWNAAINLTAIRTPDAIARDHVLDSLAGLPVLRAHGIDAFVDLGSGGGFPGLPLALALPARRALLVDSVAKKARFLEAAVAALDAGDRVAVAAARSEALAAGTDREAWPAVLTRAVASLAELAELAFPLLRHGGILIAWKRIPLADELVEARSALAAVGGGPLEIVRCEVEGLADHVLVVATKVRGTPSSFPRPPGSRRRRPL
jgi:16S rRNA (guanine527-N7)-methyltransferase